MAAPSYEALLAKIKEIEAEAKARIDAAVAGLPAEFQPTAGMVEKFIVQAVDESFGTLRSALIDQIRDAVTTGKSRVVKSGISLA